MKRQKLLVIVTSHSTIEVTEMSEATLEAHVNDADELTIKVTLPANELGQIPLDVVCFNRYETKKIRRVLEHTK